MLYHDVAVVLSKTLDFRICALFKGTKSWAASFDSLHPMRYDPTQTLASIVVLVSFCGDFWYLEEEEGVLGAYIQQTNLIIFLCIL